jgi:hypothetical protein
MYDIQNKFQTDFLEFLKIYSCVCRTSEKFVAFGPGLKEDEVEPDSCLKRG